MSYILLLYFSCLNAFCCRNKKQFPQGINKGIRFLSLRIWLSHLQITLRWLPNIHPLVEENISEVHPILLPKSATTCLDTKTTLNSYHFLITSLSLPHHFLNTFLNHFSAGKVHRQSGQMDDFMKLDVASTNWSYDKLCVLKQVNDFVSIKISNLYIWLMHGSLFSLSNVWVRLIGLKAWSRMTRLSLNDWLNKAKMAQCGRHVATELSPPCG